MRDEPKPLHVARIAYREKDRAFVRVLLVESLVEADTLLARIDVLPIDEDRRLALSRWVRRTAAELEWTDTG